MSVGQRGKKRYIVAMYMFFILISLSINLIWAFISLFSSGIAYSSWYNSSYTYLDFIEFTIYHIIVDIVILIVDLVISRMAYLKSKVKKQYNICKIISFLVFITYVCIHIYWGVRLYMNYFC